jgi:hypothetical protein
LSPNHLCNRSLNLTRRPDRTGARPDKEARSHRRTGLLGPGLLRRDDLLLAPASNCGPNWAARCAFRSRRARARCSGRRDRRRLVGAAWARWSSPRAPMLQRALVGQGGQVGGAPERNGDEEGGSYRRSEVSRRRRPAWRSGRALVGFLRRRVGLDVVAHNERRTGKHRRGSSPKEGPGGGAPVDEVQHWQPASCAELRGCSETCSRRRNGVGVSCCRRAVKGKTGESGGGLQEVEKQSTTGARWTLGPSWLLLLNVNSYSL